MKPILISDILKDKHITITQGKRPINPTWEEASYFAKPYKIPVPVVLRWFRQYGKARVLNLSSWLADITLKDKRPPIGLCVFKLKQLAEGK